jgi:signal transduction histidine kinase
MRPAADLLGLRLEELPAPFIARVAGLVPGASAVLPLQGSRRVRWLKSSFLDRGFPRTLLVVEELTEELRRSERAAYEKIIRTLSHEINNSIAAAASLVESCLHYKGQVRPEDRADFETALSVANPPAPPQRLRARVRGCGPPATAPPHRLRPGPAGAGSGAPLPARVRRAGHRPRARCAGTPGARRGIGLTLAQEILTQHGFGFALESRVDEPTRFTIQL